MYKYKNNMEVVIALDNNDLFKEIEPFFSEISVSKDKRFYKYRFISYGDENEYYTDDISLYLASAENFNKLYKLDDLTDYYGVLLYGERDKLQEVCQELFKFQNTGNRFKIFIFESLSIAKEFLKMFVIKCTTNLEMDEDCYVISETFASTKDEIKIINWYKEDDLLNYQYHELVGMIYQYSTEKDLIEYHEFIERTANTVKGDFTEWCVLCAYTELVKDERGIFTVSVL